MSYKSFLRKLRKTITLKFDPNQIDCEDSLKLANNMKMIMVATLPTNWKKD